MKITLVPEDNVVVFNRVHCVGAQFTLSDPNVRAVHWDADKGKPEGHIEYYDGTYEQLSELPSEYLLIAQTESSAYDQRVQDYEASEQAKKDAADELEAQQLADMLAAEAENEAIRQANVG